ncbi:MAG: hypothetical protein QXS20_07780 [Candidatus Thorarchaeota archaeon]
MTVLEYRDNQFHECVGQPNAEVILKVDDTAKKLILTIPSSVNLVTARAAERCARSIEKSGFQTAKRGRIGRGYELVIEGHGGALPDRLRKSPREVY